MFKKLNYFLFLLVGLLLLALPMEKVNSLSLSNDSVRVISLAANGRDRANAIVFSSDGSQLAVGASAGIYLFDSTTLSQNHFIPTETWVRDLAISANGRILAAGLFDNTARLWNLSDLQSLQIFRDHGSWVRSIAFTPDGRLLATAADDNTIRLWNNENGSLQLKIENLKGVRSLAISPNGAILAIGLQDNTIQLRSLTDGELLKTLMGHEGWVRCLVFSPDGQKLASGAFDATARLWDVASGQLLYTLSGHKSSVLGIAFSPDGASLATGSVDKTVRLWNVVDGSFSKVMIGHEGFVYSVAFSPDGKILATGAGDNTVRLWDLSMASNDMTGLPHTPSDCRVCHHPMTSTKSPAVVEVSCEVCHPGGAGLNWCPYFPRSLSKVSGTETHTTSSMQKVGIPVRSESLEVTIFSPANGEMLYSKSNYVAPVTVSGKVASFKDSLEDVNINLEVWSGSTLISTLTQSPAPDGSFKFLLGVNPTGYMLRINDPAAPFSCANCHDDFYVQAYLPSGHIHLIVVAKTQAGEQASDERWFGVDVGHTETINVIARDASSGEPIEGLFIQSFARFYEWRGRSSNAVSTDAGAATLTVEVLSQASTAYEISIPDQVVNGVFYSSQHTGTVVIEPGVVSAPDIAIDVDAKRGQINGTLVNSDNTPLDSIPVWVFSLPAGPAFHAETTKGGLFSFKDLPVSEYLVFPDSKIMDSYSLTGNQQVIDLTQSPIGDVVIKSFPSNGLTVSGRVEDSEGKWLPFAWLDALDDSTYPIDLESGSWMVSGVSMDGQNWVASAPGYYSQEIKLSKDNLDSDLASKLQRRSDIEIVNWGNGEIIVPAETDANIAENSIEVENGWIWGNSFDGQPFVLKTAEAEIKLSSGQFALERLPGNVSWFYLFSGQAELRSQRTGQVLNLQTGDMVALLEHGHLLAIPYEQEIVSALQSIDGIATSPVWKPSLVGQVWETLARLGINTAQIVTFITYFIVVSSLIIIVPWFTIRSWLKRRRVSGEKNE